VKNPLKLPSGKVGAVFAAVSLVLIAPIGAVAIAAQTDSLRPLALTDTTQTNNGNHGSKSTDNSAECTKNNDNNAQNNGNCPGDVPASD